MKDKDFENFTILFESKIDKKYYYEIYKRILKNNKDLTNKQFNDYIIQFNNKYKDVLFNEKYKDFVLNDQYLYTYINNKAHYDKSMNIFTKNLQDYALKCGKTITDISKDLGIAYSTVSDWFNGRKYPRPNKISILADYLGVLPSDLTEEHTIDHIDNNKSKGAIVPVLGRIPARYPY